MAKHVLKDASLVVNGVNLSDHVRSVTIETSRPEVDVTAMGSANQEFAPGIGDATITVEFLQDYAAASVDATLWPLATADTTFSVVTKPTSGAVSATNPSYTMTARIYGYQPLAGAVGDANSTTVTFRNAASAGIVRATS